MLCALAISFLIAGLIGMGLLLRPSYHEPPGPRKAWTGFQACCCLAGGGLLAGLLYALSYANAPRKVVDGQMTSLHCWSGRHGDYSEFTVVTPDNQSVPLWVADCGQQWHDGDIVTARYVSGFSRPLSLQVSDGSKAGRLYTYADNSRIFLFLSILIPAFVVALAAYQWKKDPDGVSRSAYQRGQEITALQLNR